MAKEGLSEEEVVRFVNDLIVRQRAQLQQQAHPEAQARLLSQRMMVEAQRDSAALRVRAKREAEAEIARLVSEAQQRAQEIIKESREKARVAAEQEGQNTLEMASQKAQLVEAQTLQTAHLFLLRVREEIQNQVATETKEVYSRLLSSLQALQATAQSAETEWANRKLVPQWGSPSELKDYQAGLLDSLMPGGLSAGILANQEEAGQEAGERDMGSTTSTKPLEDLTLAMEEEPLAARRFTATGEPVAAASEGPREGMDPAEEQASAKREESGSTVLHDALKSVMAEQSEAPGGREKPLGDAGPEEGAPPGGPQLYHGEIDLSINPPASAARVTSLYTHLQSIPGLKVLRTAGSWDRGTVMTITLDRPVSMTELLSNIPDLEVDPGNSGKQSSPGVGKSKQGRQKVNIFFRDQSHAKEVPVDSGEAPTKEAAE